MAILSAPLQLQALENFFSEEKCPTQKAIKRYAAVLGLTYKQVRGWFVERRRRDRRDGELSDVPLSEIRRQCLLAVENRSKTTAMPENALIGVWRNCAHNLSTRRLGRTSSITELLQVLADFVHAINRNWLLHCSVTGCDGIFGEEIVTYFPTIPQTSSAIALWLTKLDTLVRSHCR